MSFERAKLNKSIPVPLYYQLKEMILEALKDGTYQPDDMLPTEKELGDMFDISRTTVRQAVTELVQEGWLYRVKSKGTFVKQPKIRQDFIARIIPFHEEMLLSGKKPETEVLEFKKTAASDVVADALGLAVSDEVIYLHRRRFADGEPIVTVETWLPCPACAFLLEHDLTKESMYEVMSVHEETKIFSARRQVEAVEATAADARYLGIKKGKPVQLFRTYGRNARQEPIEYSVARYRADRNSFEVTAFVDDRESYR